MSASAPHGATRIRDLGLTIEGTRLERVCQRFLAECDALGLPFRPRLYLSTEWGVPFGTIAIAIPFYLAHPELERLQLERFGHVEGYAEYDVLRYLRHEMGHVVSYAYRLYEREDFVERYGSITRPYVEDYRPEPFSRAFVRHLPGWYAQKHPDEDWSETFAVWMTPGLDWRREYAGWPVALAKLEHCDQTMRSLRGRPPIVLEDALDLPVSEVDATLDEVYRPLDDESLPPGIEGALKAVFDDLGNDSSAPRGEQSAATFMRALERHLPAEVYRWTGHFPERTHALLRAMERIAQHLDLRVRAGDEARCTIALTALVTALAESWVRHGTYLP
ncbi:hypothetical protein [Sandaracinus amylolyticus]|uniref:Zinc-binding metallo-peptidase n=1 Tax=Sandaracinus amylolyticus TaxID=927083 RepID=A0A0F6VYN7_9BACT|nr:hypothetical protein [Sandaracinus amylolyticus]AKF02961.1 hypothetical protein DB32_000109 [Sandaracinus amylolyticus]